MNTGDRMPQKRTAWTLLASVLVASSSLVETSKAADDLKDAITGGDLLLNTRLRYENVDQSGFSEDAQAVTARLRLGYETAPYKGFRFLGEIDKTEHIGADRFNSLENGRTNYPIVADPDSFRLNRAQLTYERGADSKIVLGRQRIILDDSRFVGNVGWRQNEQTYDSVRLSTKALPDTQVEYGYIWRVNRIFGSESPLGSWDSDSHFARAAYSGLNFLNVAAFGYWLDLETAPGASSETYGLRLWGDTSLSETVSLSYAGSYAQQTEYGNNPGDFDLDYYALEGGVTWNKVTAKAGMESLEGNGSRGFTTPLATLHKFQGFADVFLATPTVGIEDVYGTVSVKSKWANLEKPTTFSLIYHDYEAESSSADLGSEWNAVIAVPLPNNLKVLAKYADYDGNGFRDDRRKAWFSIELAL